MYIKINQPINKIQMEEITKALECLNANFEVYNTPLQMFCKEEAEYRLEEYEGCHLVDFDDEARKDMIDNLAYRLYDSDYVVDCETIMNITSDLMMEYENKLIDQAV